MGSIGDSSILAAYGVANVATTLVAVILLGLNSALGTLVSQSYGSNDIDLCRIYISRSRVIATLAFIPFAILLQFSKTYFELSNVGDLGASGDPLREEAAWYVRLNLIALFIGVQFDISRSAVNAMG